MLADLVQFLSVLPDVARYVRAYLATFLADTREVVRYVWDVIR